MKAYQIPMALAAIFALQACTSVDNKDQQPQSIPATLDQPTSIAPQTFIMRGEVVVGHEARSFTPCGSNHQMWLALSPEQTQKALSLVRAPYEPLYGELIGHLQAPTNNGLDADFNAVFVVDEINMLTAENPRRCGQAPKATRAFGMEPGWSATFNKQTVTFQTMGSKPQELTIERSQISSTKREYQLDRGQLTLEAGRCSDTMSDSTYGWTSSLTLDDKQYKGCATLANVDSTLNWTGLYQAASTKTSDFSIRLQLNPDHTATTSYDYNNGDPATIERGYWQQLNPDQIQVVMTRHQQQYLVSERIFTRDGEQINAEKERVGEIVYPIANGGLTLFKAKQEGASPAPKQ